LLSGPRWWAPKGRGPWCTAPLAPPVWPPLLELAPLPKKNQLWALVCLQWIGLWNSLPHVCYHTAKLCLLTAVFEFVIVTNVTAMYNSKNTVQRGRAKHQRTQLQSAFSNGNTSGQGLFTVFWWITAFDFFFWLVIVNIYSKFDNG